MLLEQLFTHEQHSWELGIWTGEHSCSILGVFVTWGVSPWEPGALQLPVFCGTQQEPPALHLCPGALHPVEDKMEWRWHKSGRWAGMSAASLALMGLGSEKREGFLSFAKFSMIAVFSSSPNNSCLD